MNDLEQIQIRLDKLEKSDRYVFEKLIQLFDGTDIQISTKTGSKIGTAAGQKLSFHGVTPVVQAGAISAANTQGGTYNQTDVQSIVTAVNSIITVLKNKGLTA